MRLVYCCCCGFGPVPSLVSMSVRLQAKSPIIRPSSAGLTFKGGVLPARWDRDPEIQLSVSWGGGGPVLATRELPSICPCQESCSPGKGLSMCPLLRGKPLTILQGQSGSQFVTSPSHPHPPTPTPTPVRFLPLSFSWLWLHFFSWVMRNKL